MEYKKKIQTADKKSNMPPIASAGIAAMSPAVIAPGSIGPLGPVIAIFYFLSRSC